MSLIDEYKALNERPASVLTVGGFRPTGDPTATHFGLRPLMLSSESWPTSDDGTPLYFVCQLNITHAPYSPPILGDLALLTFFVNPELSLLGDTNGEGWCLRAYTSLAGLVPVVVPRDCGPKRGFEASWRKIMDYPVYDNPGRCEPPGYIHTDSHPTNVRQTKLGGWPSNIQSEQWWESRRHRAAPAYCLQIESEDKVQLMWGDSGTIYLARGTKGRQQGAWFLDFQCY